MVFVSIFYYCVFISLFMNLTLGSCNYSCDHMADGVHVKMYVDIMRAKMLFNHLCDENMNWIGSSSRFL